MDQDEMGTDSADDGSTYSMHPMPSGAVEGQAQESNDRDELLIAGGIFEKTDFAKEIHYHMPERPTVSEKHIAPTDSLSAFLTKYARRQERDSSENSLSERMQTRAESEGHFGVNISPPSTTHRKRDSGAALSELKQVPIESDETKMKRYVAGIFNKRKRRFMKFESTDSSDSSSSDDQSEEFQSDFAMPSKGLNDQAMMTLVRAQPPYVPRHGRRRKLADNVTAYPEMPLSSTSKIYPGIQKMALGMRRPVAVKIVTHSPKKMREARNLLKLTPHVNVVAIIDANELRLAFTRTIYVVMEQCQTMSLESYYQKRKEDNLPFNTRLALEFSRQVAEGINHIHKNNIIHRDLKPSSILFSLDGKNLKIIDFGVSKELEYGLSTMSISSGDIGTDGYRAPETYKRDEINMLADIFSLAIVLYYIWSYGLHPFGGERLLWSYNIKSGHDPQLLGLLVPNKEKARDLLENMLQQKYRERYKIGDVLDHQYIRKGVRETMLHGCSEAWKGIIESSDGPGGFTIHECALLKESDVNIIGIEEPDLKWRISVIAALSLKSLKESINGAPSGYLKTDITAKHALMRKLSEGMYKMAWINIFSDDNKRSMAFIIVSPPGYEELIGIFIEDPDKFIKKFKDQILDKEFSSPINTSDYTPANVEPTSSHSDTGRGSSVATSATEVYSDITSEESSPIKTEYTKIRTAEYIPWWISM